MGSNAVGSAVIALLLAVVGCSGKERPFGSGSIAGGPEAGGPDEGANEPGASNEGRPAASTESGAIPGAYLGPDDAGANQSQLPAMTPAGGECTPGATRCASISERVECGADALWATPSVCPFVCTDGTCAGECVSGDSECLSSTRVRSCSDLGSWSEPSECDNACIGAACGGECKPGQTRCATTTTVQTCDDQGQWGETTACQNACAGEACAGECTPGSTRCSSETQFQACSPQGQFQIPTACQFACVNDGCGGECSPGTRRCAGGAPQLCSDAGLWQAQAPCQFVCTGSGSCSGECSPGARRCSPQSGVPQLCSQAGIWQNQNACPFGQECGGGECVASTPPATLATSSPPGQIGQTLVGDAPARVRWTVINNGGQATEPLRLEPTFDTSEFGVENNCIGRPLPPGSTCGLDIVFTPQRPAGSRSATFRVTAGVLAVEVTLAGIPVRYGPAGECTFGAANECGTSLFCTIWYLDQDEDGYGGQPESGGAPTLSVCSNGLDVGRPADINVDLGAVFGVHVLRYVLPPNTGDCCDLINTSTGLLISTPFHVNPGVTESRARPASACPLPDDFNCDGQEVCTTIRAEDGTLCL